MPARIPEPTNMTVNLAPMVDVMMCLIIFFLLGSRLVAEQHGKADLAYAQAAHEVERGELGSRVVVNIRALSNDGLDSEIVVHGWDGQRIQESTLSPEELNRYLERRSAQAREHDEDLRCVIRADKNVPYARVESALAACGQAGISKVIFSANAGTDPEEAK